MGITDRNSHTIDTIVSSQTHRCTRTQFISIFCWTWGWSCYPFGTRLFTFYFGLDFRLYRPDICCCCCDFLLFIYRFAVWQQHVSTHYSHFVNCTVSKPLFFLCLAIQSCFRCDVETSTSNLTVRIIFISVRLVTLPVYRDCLLCWILFVCMDFLEENQTKQ